MYFLAQITSVSTGSDGFQHVKGTVQNLNTFAVGNARLVFTLYQNPTDNPLRAIAMGFRRLYGDRDHEKLEAQMPMYDALYAWCQEQVAA